MNNVRDNSLLIAFGLHLQALRKAKGFTLQELANEADVELSQIHRIEKGKINPTLSTLFMIAKAFGIELSDLVEFKL